MFDLVWYVYLLLIAVAFFAGVMDALAGGGGLITVPALLFSGVNPIAALGTDKLQSAIGEFSATLHFFRHSDTRYRYLAFGLLYSVIGAIAGVIALQYFPLHRLEKMIPLLMLLLLLYYIFSGCTARACTRDGLSGYCHRFFLKAATAIGFYNGFFGPGTGTLWAITLMRGMQLDIKQATAYTKPLNLAANLAALTIFIWSGQVDFWIALIMSAGSFTGGKVGASLVIYKNARWVKTVFLSLMAISTLMMFIKYYS